MAKKSGGKGHGWLVPAVIGLAVGFFASPMIARFTHIQPMIK